MKKFFATSLALALAAFLLAGCAAVDVILQHSPSSLDKLVEKFPAIITDHTQNERYYSLTVDGETMLKVSSDYSLTGAEDLLIQTPLKPFVDAGLDPEKLGAGYRADAESFYFVADFGAGTGEKSTFTSALYDSVAADRSVLDYHADLDHYGIKLPTAKFEWAKDEATNDKDIVFVLAAQPLADLGVDVQNIEGWIYMIMQDDAGRDLPVLLKPYSLAS
jgi:hypothetical protein